MAAHDDLARRLARPGTVPLADGLEVTVVAIRPLLDDRWEVRYSVPGLPDGAAELVPPHSDDLDEAASEYAGELHGWATEHVRRYRPLPPPDLDAIKRDLPDRDALWQQLRERFDDATEVEEGLRGIVHHDEVTLVTTPEQWQEYVAWCEVRCRRDAGVDADGPGDGPYVAWERVDEYIATLDEGEHFVVFDGQRFHRSTRRELPAVRSGASRRRTQEIIARTQGRGQWRAYPPGSDQGPSGA